MIRSFADRATERLFADDICPAAWRGFKAAAVRKLDIIDAATRLDDLRPPPGNCLEALKAVGKGSGISASIVNGGFASDGRPTDRQM